MDRVNEERLEQTKTTKDAFVNDENFDPEEALEEAIDKIKFLLKRLYSDTRPINTLWNDTEYYFTCSHFTGIAAHSQ